MEYIYNYVNNKTKIIINSPNPKDITDSNDLRAILLDEYPNLRNDYFVLSNVHANTALLVGDNINCKGRVLIEIKQKSNQLLKGENNNAKCWEYTIE
ncbi:hypothetical protein [Spiroplasma endosymbiont of Colias croceus]|uniref:hypothetical protein n=1 Tax=Spiroplasma endosymbiont of Colias croceus TaxID=3066310 RepID=UPI0030CBA379